MKHIKDLKLNEEYPHHGYAGSTFADISTQTIMDILVMQLKELGYDKHFFTNPSVKRYLENHSKDMMNGFWNEIKDKEKIEKLSKDLEREYEGPDHPFFPTGVFPDPTKKNKV